MGVIEKYKNLAKAFPFKNSGIYLLNEVFLKGVNLAYLPLLTAYLLPEEFGILSNLTSGISFLLFIIALNLNNYVAVQFSREEKLTEPNLLKQYFNSLVSILLFFTIILLLLACIDFRIVREIFQSKLNALLLITIAFFETLVSYKVNSSIIRGEPKTVLKLTLVKNVIDFSLTFFFIAALRWSYLSRLIGLLLSGVCCLIFFRKEALLLNFHLVSNIKKGTRFLKGSVALIPHELSLWLRGGMDRILILNIIGSHLSGIYALAFQLALILAVAAAATNNALIPKIYKYKGDKRFTKNYFSYFKIYTIIISTLFIGMFFLFPILAEKIISKKYEGFVFYYRILLIGFLFKSFYFYFANVILYRSAAFHLSKISITVSIIHLVLMLTFVKKIGLLGATIIFCCSELLMMSIVVFRGIKILKKQV